MSKVIDPSARYSRRQVAELLSVNEDTVKRWTRLGVFPKLGRRGISGAAILEYLDKTERKR